jgi:hypothetical protein
MPFDPENPFASADPSQWLPTRAPLRITVHPKPPPSDGIDESDGGPNDWFVPGNAPADSFPDDWFVPPSATPNIGQFPPGAQPNTNFRSAYPAVRPDPFAAYWSQIPASRLGALAWAPPYLPPSSPSSDNFPSPTLPPAPLILRTPTLGLDPFPWSSTHSLPSPTVPEGGFLSALATLGPPSPPWSARQGGLLGAPVTLGMPPPPAPSTGGFLGVLPPWSAGQGGLLGAPATLGMPPPPAPSTGGFLGALATLGTSPPPPWSAGEGGLLDKPVTLGMPAMPPLATPTSSLAGGYFPGSGRPTPPPMPSTLQAFWQGLGSGTRQVAQTVQSAAGPPTITPSRVRRALPLEPFSADRWGRPP